MNKISDAEIYQAAAALLRKHQNNPQKAANFIIDQLWKYSDPLNEEMLEITRRIDNALFELTDLSTVNRTIQ